MPEICTYGWRFKAAFLFALWKGTYCGKEKRLLTFIEHLNSNSIITYSSILWKNYHSPRRWAKRNKYYNPESQAQRLVVSSNTSQTSIQTEWTSKTVFQWCAALAINIKFLLTLRDMRISLYSTYLKLFFTFLLNFVASLLNHVQILYFYLKLIHN